MTKSFRARKPLTEVALTELGRKAFAEYAQTLGTLLGHGG